MLKTAFIGWLVLFGATATTLADPSDGVDPPPADESPATQAAEQGDADAGADADVNDKSDTPEDNDDARKAELAARRKARAEARRAQREAERQQKEMEAELRRAMGEQFMDVRVIYRRFLEPGERDGDAEKFEDGRQRLLAIHEPLAIPAIVEILSKGGYRCRRVMVEALDAFVGEDDATMYLIMATLFDPSAAIRDMAAMALDKRSADPRIADELRNALDSDEEPVIRHAATALAHLHDKQAVPELIDRLSMDVRVEVPISRAQYVNGIGTSYVSGYRAVVAPGASQIVPIVNYAPTGLSFGDAEDGVIVEYHTVFRTEVRDALVTITGVDFAFDMDAWRDWWATHKN